LFAVSTILIPQPTAVDRNLYATLPQHNFVDGLVWKKLEQLSVAPSKTTDDATYHRRAFLDVIGRLPTPDESRDFLNDAANDKRSKLVDNLLERTEYADYWANKWADLLRPNPYRVGVKAVFTLDAWLREAFRSNMPYDQFVREIVAARGTTYRNGATVVLRDRREPDELTTMFSQLFLGIRLDCAKCHHHPFEVWGQDDFYRMAAFFQNLDRKGTGLSPPISGSEEMFFNGQLREVKHPATGETMKPKPLFGDWAPPPADADPRDALVDWMVRPDNPYFAQVMANRVWADLMGRGVVEPIDDLRATNPPSNGPLLVALGEDFRRNKFDVKKLIAVIMKSHVYELDSMPGLHNVADTRNYSRHYRQRLRAEVLLDAISDVTGMPEKFDAMPPGSRAAELWTLRAPSLFLDSFGRPDANQDPPCERLPDTTLVQALHLMNAPDLYKKVSADDGRAAVLAKSPASNDKIVEEAYLWAYGRVPTSEETRRALSVWSGPNDQRRAWVEDLFWSLLNTPEFVFKN
ncbi:MAG: DUF1549 and DUF1553 domain-containing protein, partial [Planctomycetia bacterium]